MKERIVDGRRGGEGKVCRRWEGRVEINGKNNGGGAVGRIALSVISTGGMVSGDISKIAAFASARAFGEIQTFSPAPAHALTLHQIQHGPHAVVTVRSLALHARLLFSCGPSPITSTYRPQPTRIPLLVLPPQLTNSHSSSCPPRHTLLLSMLPIAIWQSAQTCLSPTCFRASASRALCNQCIGG